MSLNNKKILVLMTGSIAAFKACGIISKLVQAGAKVKVVQSRSCAEFIGNATIEGLTGRPAIRDELFAPGVAMEHIHLIREADLILVCPATANYLNKTANGVGDDLISTLFLAHDFKKPFLIAPAMNTSMYLHPVTQQSIQKLKNLGIEILETASGVLACGESGLGKLLEPELIISAIEETIEKELNTPLAAPPKAPALKVLITGGGTIEPIDQVRFIGNHSTGRTAAHLAEALFDLGFAITYLGARNGTRPERDVEFIEFETFNDLQNLLKHSLSHHSYQAAIHLAAVSDYSVDSIANELGPQSSSIKIPSGSTLHLKLKPNPKLVNSLREWSLNKKIHLTAFKMTVEASEKQIIDSVRKVFSQADVDQVIHNDTRNISQDRHGFTIYNRELTSIANGQNKSQMAAAIYSLLPREEK